MYGKSLAEVTSVVFIRSRLIFGLPRTAGTNLAAFGDPRDLVFGIARRDVSLFLELEGIRGTFTYYSEYLRP